MGILSIFQTGVKYFDKKIPAKCDYCQHGKRTNAGNKILCEKKGLVDPNYSCNSFIYSPLKRIPVKQLNFVGSLADEDIYIESAGDRAEKEKEASKQNNDDKSAKNEAANNDSAKKDEPKNELDAPKAQESKENAANEKNSDDKSPAPAEENVESTEKNNDNNA
ncbi:MAG: hypothetical protein IJM38_07215 [Ruminococcus sp.]|nr:hypothetical protein [Ruminococcus sp.]